MPTSTVYYLELNSKSELIAGKTPDIIPEIKECTIPDWRLNRFLYEWVGADWKWTDKLSWNETQWKEYSERSELKTYLALIEGNITGYFELELQSENNIQLSYFGLTPNFIGKNIGSWLLCQSVEIAWQLNAKRVWVHTCSEDHPAALPNYKARGFRLYKTETITPE